MSRLSDDSVQAILATPHNTLSDYRATVFPECLSAGLNPAFSMETPEVWVTIRSLKLFLKYYKNPSKRVRLKRPLDSIEENEIRDYREFLLPVPLQRSPFFTVANANTWVSVDHFYAFLASREDKRGGLPDYDVAPRSPTPSTSPTSPTSDQTLVNPPRSSRTRSQSGVRIESVENVRSRRNSYAKERPSVHATPKKPDYQLRRRASISVPRQPVFVRPQIEPEQSRGLSPLLGSSSPSDMSSASSSCSNSTITSLPSEYKSSLTSPLTHLQLLGHRKTSAMIIHRPRTSYGQPDVYEVYPNIDEHLETYLSSPKKYYHHIPFSRYYDTLQQCYAVPVESGWAKKHIGRVDSSVKKPRSRRSSRVTEEEPLPFPEEYGADLFRNEETSNGFMAIAKAASVERGITGYRW